MEDNPINNPNNNPTPNTTPTPPTQPPRKPLSLVKRIFIILFGTVCLFGLWDTFFPSKPPTINQTTNTTAKTTPTAPTWKTFTNAKYNYAVKYPDNLETSQTTPYSTVFTPKQKPGAPLTFPQLYISVIPDGFTDKTAIYNFMPENIINKFFTLQDNQTQIIQPEGDSQYWTFKKLATIPVADTAGIMIQNDKVWEGETALRNRRILIKKNNKTYIIGSYYQTQPELNTLHDFLLSFKFLQ